MFANCLRKTSVNYARFGWVAQAPNHVPIPDHPARQRGFYLYNESTHPIPVHRRDALSTRGTCGTAPRVGMGLSGEYWSVGIVSHWDRISASSLCACPFPLDTCYFHKERPWCALCLLQCPATNFIPLSGNKFACAHNRDARHQRVAGVSAAHRASRNGTSHTILSRHRPPQPVPGPHLTRRHIAPTGQNSRRPVSPDDTTRHLLRRSPCLRSTLEGVRAIMAGIS